MANFCYDFDTQKYIHIAEREVLSRSILEKELRFLDMSSVDDHNTYYWQWDTVDKLPPYTTLVPDWNTTVFMNEKQVKVIDRKVHIVKRFFPANIFHLIHDDLLGMLDIREREGGFGEYWFVDDYTMKGEYDQLYRWLDRQARFKQLKGEKAQNRMICFKDAVIGNSKRYVWYQYGFKLWESPTNHTITVSEISSAFRKLVGIGSDGNLQFLKARKQFYNNVKKRRQHETDNLQAVVFFRKSTRLLLNYEELAGALRVEFKIQVKKLALEDVSPEAMILEMQKTAIVVGMHGSLLTMIGWMPPGGVVIEAFPYAIPPENYAPFRELARIMGHQHRAWASPYADPPWTVGHVSKPRHMGGEPIFKNRTEQDSVLAMRWVPRHKCCYNQAWLYRLNQDTRVDLSDVINLIYDAIDRMA